jgi:hypothetical protein
MNINVHALPQNEAGMSFAINQMDAVELNNEAVSASKRGDYARAVEAHLQALKIKEHLHGSDSYHTAITCNGLGED